MKPKISHRWVEIQPIQKGPAEFPSIYGQGGCTKINIYSCAYKFTHTGIIYDFLAIF